MEQKAKETTSFISLPKKVVLLTYNRPDLGQYFYDCSFNIPTDIPPGPSGLYWVTINEALFMSSHPILEMGDELMIAVGSTDYTIKILGRIFSATVNDLITELNRYLTELGCPLEFSVPAQTINGFQLGFKSESEKKPFSISYSINFGYIFNNINNTQVSFDGSPLSWPNVRLTGPFNYILNSNMIPEVPTLNELGQTFNMSLLTYNVCSRLGEIVQMAGTMRCMTSNITKIRFQLINDQGDLVKITSPIYLQLTIEPYMPPRTNSEYYK